MRGSAFFNSLFNTDNNLKPTVRRGRSSILVQKRNELLLLRYYFYGNFTELRYKAVLKRLREEFFISEARILDIISKNHTVLKNIKEKDISLTELRKEYPHFSWLP